MRFRYALDLTDNPGAPFALPAVLEPAGKVDGVAQVRLRLPAGSLFPMEFDVSAVNAEVFPSRLSIAQGAETSALAAVVSDGGGPMTVTWSAPAVPVQLEGRERVRYGPGAPGASVAAATAEVLRDEGGRGLGLVIPDSAILCSPL